MGQAEGAEDVQGARHGPDLATSLPVIVVRNCHIARTLPAEILARGQAEQISPGQGSASCRDGRCRCEENDFRYSGVNNR
jgi:hypothetical protein